MLGEKNDESLPICPMSISSIQAGRIICELSGWRTSNLRLQKLLYIACMNFIGTDTSNPRLLIRQDFEAWKYGPVEPNLYNFCSDFGSSDITNVFPYERIKDDYPKEYEMLEFIVNWGRNKTPGYLLGYTHKKKWAWYRTKRLPEKVVIPYSEIQRDYILEKEREDAEREKAIREEVKAATDAGAET